MDSRWAEARTGGDTLTRKHVFNGQRSCPEQEVPRDSSYVGRSPGPVLWTGLHRFLLEHTGPARHGRRPCIGRCATLLSQAEDTEV